jgi:hypothetical protein
VVGIGSSWPQDFRFFGGFFSGSWVEFLDELPSLPFSDRGGVRMLSAGDITVSSPPNRETKLSSDVERRESAGLKLEWFMAFHKPGQMINRSDRV